MPVCGDTTYKNVAERKDTTMEFLKEVLGEELYNQLIAKVNAYNGDEANKDKLIKLVNLSALPYTPFDRHIERVV